MALISQATVTPPPQKNLSSPSETYMKNRKNRLTIDPKPTRICVPMVSYFHRNTPSHLMGKNVPIQARDSDEREKWVRRLEDTILRHAHRVRGLYYNNGSSVSDASGGTAKRPNYLQTLDKRVSEADAYLQLMIEQTNVI